MSSRVLGPLVALAFWFALWGEVSIANLITGCVVVAVLWAWRSRTEVGPGYRVHPLAVIRLLGTLIGQLVVGSVRIAAAVVAPNEARMRATFVDVDLRSNRPLTMTLVADLISLVPGSLTVDAWPEEGRLRAHVMGYTTVEDARQAIHHLEDVVLAAFEPIEDPAGEAAP